MRKKIPSCSNSALGDRRCCYCEIKNSKNKIPVDDRIRDKLAYFHSCRFLVQRVQEIRALYFTTHFKAAKSREDR